ncbi:MAG: hypothetical protein J0665_14390, partial [Deltaproteobacteria bacterium]|nr:hypothetical protein [Deltaproteobacteria bacterium]
MGKRLGTAFLSLLISGASNRDKLLLCIQFVLYLFRAQQTWFYDWHEVCTKQGTKAGVAGYPAGQAGYLECTEGDTMQKLMDDSYKLYIDGQWVDASTGKTTSTY